MRKPTITFFLVKVIPCSNFCLFVLVDILFALYVFLLFLPWREKIPNMVCLFLKFVFCKILKSRLVSVNKPI